MPWAICIASLFLAFGCTGDNEKPPSRPPTLVAILTDGRLVTALPDKVTKTVRLTDARLRPASRRLIAVTPTGRLMGVLLVPAGSERSEVALVTADRLAVRARVSLPMESGAKAAVLVAPTRNRLVVLGDRRTPAGERLPIGWVVDVQSGELLKRWTFSEQHAREADVIDAAAASDGKRLYLSYHGGVDVISWQSGRLLCRERSPRGWPCITPFHGEVAASPKGVLGTGADEQTILQANGQGRLTGRWPTRLAGNHLMRFAYDPTGDRAFALGSCLYTGGIARVDLKRGLVWRRGMRRASQPTLCGERIAAMGSFVAFSRGPEFEGPSDSQIEVVDAHSGSVRARLPVPAPAADLSFVR